ncbi:glycosyltransferase family 2 protein [Methanoregula sp.]|uniref:glycosyltransferase n=1 Tax=Methanoregula sp. TaxID=2052170 RepID=UPI00236F2680|nr:glycosyltransferase family 2 protein [Methanoregula sp.]MDD1686818.1 glycosyltransferase family 2 protein [Methanoregula sp.]
MYDLTVIIPTFKEEANIRTIITEVDAVFRKNALNGEILVVDDNSPDNTIAIVNELKGTKTNVNLLVRTSDHGLSQSVADGFLHASSEIFVVIDADMSHPPALIAKMYDEIRAGNDVVIGSRYMEGGGIKKWPLKRRIISLGATFLGRLLFPEITDPVSGFFAIRKNVVAQAQLKPRGYKILLEVLGKGVWEHDKEIPFEFSDREIGTSKLKIKTIIEYAQQVADITLYSFVHHQSAAWREWKKVFKFGIVGISGIVINQGVLVALKEYAGFSIPVASICAIQLAILNNFLWNDTWTFKSKGQPQRLSSRWQRLVAFEAVSLGGAVINFAILNAFVMFLAMDYQIANIIGILLGFIWNFFVNRRFTWVTKRT